MSNKNFSQIAMEIIKYYTGKISWIFLSHMKANVCMLCFILTLYNRYFQNAHIYLKFLSKKYSMEDYES